MQEPELKGEQPQVLMEMTLRHLTSDHGIDTIDFLQRAETLRALGKTVLVSNFRRFHRLARTWAATPRDRWALPSARQT